MNWKSYVGTIVTVIHEVEILGNGYHKSVIVTIVMTALGLQKTITYTLVDSCR